MKVERIYTRGVVTTQRSDSLQKAAQTMRRLHVGALLVTEGGDGAGLVVGIVTDRDLALFAVAEALDARRVAVEKVMSPVVASVTESADALEAIERMRHAGVRRLLVTGDAGEPRGVLSIDDVVDGLAAELANASALMKSGVRREAAGLDGPRAAA